MTEFILKTYTYMKSHRMTCLFSFVAVTLLLALSVSRLEYKEDIADFLPIDSEHHNALKVFQDISGANKVFAIFQYRDTTKTDADAMVAAIDAFAEEVGKADTAHVITNLTAQVDLEKMTAVTDFVYNNIPYFLTDSDYVRIDSLLSRPDYVAGQLQQDKQMLMFPTGGILASNIQRDPLNLFTPVVQRLQHSDSGLKYEMYDGHIFSPDMQKAIVMMDSPYGASETENNSHLTAMLKTCAAKATSQTPNIDVHIIGGPVIAVTNATQIKKDSILSVIISVTLILSLLLFSFRNVRNLLLIALSIAWGWLFAMGGLALIHDRVSVIVIGISSVILGIAVNYPLHFIAHLSHTPDKRKALREIVMPLLVGNITTVGAFLALVPLQSTALRDLGLFSSFLLIGTILFVLFYLPHLSKETKEVKHTFLDRISNVSLENKPVFVVVIVILTLIFGYFSLQTKFDANMGHINYMTDEQKADMAYFQRTMTQTGAYQKVYAISSDSTFDGALDKSLRLQPCLDSIVGAKDAHTYTTCSRFIASKAEQERRIMLWQKFLKRHKDGVRTSLEAHMKTEGFAPGSFDEFYALTEKEYQPQGIAYFAPLTRTVFASNLSADSTAGRYNVVNVLSVKDGDIHKVEETLKRQGCYSFDTVSMNSAIANHLSNDFNYIGIACGCIVFFFLWLSMGSIELAILSFIPMAVSWLWILGIMALCGMEFNIVNIILATFIFGQGDDYTIFMTEGAMYEYAYRRKMLASYKHSIIISALIMFIGIGTLIVARHPALHSLAEVTIAGMFSVVLMAYVFPPLIFKFLIQTRGGYRKRPLSLIPVLIMVEAVVVFFCQLAVVYVRGFISFCLLKPTDQRRQSFRRFVQRLYRFDLAHIPTVSYRVENLGGETFDKPAVVVCNHQSMLDAAVFMALSHKTVLVSNSNPSNNPIIKRIYRWMGCVPLTGDMNENLNTLRQRVAEGYSLVVFPEGERNAKSSILRFHKGAFYMAEQLGLDIVPVFLHGLNNVLPRNSWAVYPGQMTVSIHPRIASTDKAWGNGYTERTKAIHAYYRQEYAQLATRLEDEAYYTALVEDRYRYKGTDIYSGVKKTLKNLRKCAYDTTPWIVSDTPAAIVMENKSYGEAALLYALVHPDKDVTVIEADDEKRALITFAAEGIAPKLHVAASIS